MFTEIPNFFPPKLKVREYALAHSFRKLKAFDGQVYDRVANCHMVDFQEFLEAHVGPCLLLGQGFRLNYKGEYPNNPIHVDEGWGTHAFVCYLSKAPKEIGETGTAFWSKDGDLLDVCKEEFNKAVIYRSDQPHSRWPFEAYGTNHNDGRLIMVAFFTPLSEL